MIFIAQIIGKRLPTAIKSFTQLGLIFAAISAVDASENEAARPDWYLSVALGPNWSSSVTQTGWNLDPYCYPDSACFDQIPIPNVTGYRWQYTIKLDRSAALELFLERRFGRTRLELALALQSSETEQQSTGFGYLDGSSIRPRTGDLVNATASASINERRLRTVFLDAFYEFSQAGGMVVTPYLGVGLGRTTVSYRDMQYLSDYRSMAAEVSAYNPPLPFYSTIQNTNLEDRVNSWRLHAGADYDIGNNRFIGLRPTHQEVNNITSAGRYQNHPVHSTNPDFVNTNSFSGGQLWFLSIAFRQSFGG